MKNIVRNCGVSSKSSMPNVQLAELIPLLQRPKRELQHLMADKLSGGQKHQLSLAMTLASNPRLVILDEPSAGLSPKAMEEMYAILSTIRERLSVAFILIEQKIAKAIVFSDKIVAFKQGTAFLLNDKHDINKTFFV